ncbi:hypothetical protein BDR22DRAFT_887933 [Usnea florida]
MTLVPQICRKRQPSLLIFLLLVFTFLQISSSLSTTSSLPIPIHNSLGINCRGSALCPEYNFPSRPEYIGTLIQITTGNADDCPPEYSCGPLNDTDTYLPNDHIVCLPQGKSFLGGICAFAQGKNAPRAGIQGALIKRTLMNLADHGCHVCGSAPLSGDNDPNSQGILTVNYVGGVVCKGLCPPRHFDSILQNAVNGSRVPGFSIDLIDS